MNRPSKNNNLITKFVSPLLIIYIFFSIAYSGVTIETDITDAHNNGSISHVTGYFNNTNGISITVTLSDDGASSDLTDFGTVTGHFQIGICFTNGTETPGSYNVHPNFTESDGLYYFNSNPKTVSLTRSFIIDKYTQLADWDCENLCSNGNPRFDIWIRLFENDDTVDPVGWRSMNFTDNNALEDTSDGDKIQD